MNKIWIRENTPVNTVYVTVKTNQDAEWVICRVNNRAMKESDSSDFVFCDGYLYPIVGPSEDGISLEVLNIPKLATEVLSELRRQN